MKWNERNYNYISSIKWKCDCSTSKNVGKTFIAQRRTWRNNIMDITFFLLRNLNIILFLLLTLKTWLIYRNSKCPGTANLLLIRFLGWPSRAVPKIPKASILNLRTITLVIYQSAKSIELFTYEYLSNGISQIKQTKKLLLSLISNLNAERTMKSKFYELKISLILSFYYLLHYMGWAIPICSIEYNVNGQNETLEMKLFSGSINA